MSKFAAFSEISPTYIMATEDLRHALSVFMPKNCEQVLTVAASGDHPLFCSLYGAKHVDTFDISYNAKMMMDIKTVAINLFDYTGYIDLLEKLYYTDNVIHMPCMKPVIERLPTEDYEYLTSKRGMKFFNQGRWRGSWHGRNYIYLPNNFEYKNLQKIIKKPYDFEQTDIANLSTKLDGKMYDFVHLSNIFDYITYPKRQWEILCSLFDHVNVGGCIVVKRIIGRLWLRYEPFSHNVMKKNKAIRDAMENWEFTTNIMGDVLVFTRLR